jgi:hypothetical protein
LGILLFQTTGCHSFYPWEGELPTAWNQGMDQEVLWVTVQDGVRWEMTQVTQDSIAVNGLWTFRSLDGEPIQTQKSILRGDVRLIEVKRFDGGKTALLAGGILGSLVALSIYSLSTMDFGFGSGGY